MMNVGYGRLESIGRHRLRYAGDPVDCDDPDMPRPAANDNTRRGMETPYRANVGSYDDWFMGEEA